LKTTAFLRKSLRAGVQAPERGDEPELPEVPGPEGLGTNECIVRLSFNLNMVKNGAVQKRWK